MAGCVHPMVTVTPSSLAGGPSSMFQSSAAARRSVDSSPSHSQANHSQMSRNSSKKSNNSVNCKVDSEYFFQHSHTENVRVSMNAPQWAVLVCPWHENQCPKWKALPAIAIQHLPKTTQNYFANCSRQCPTDDIIFLNQTQSSIEFVCKILAAFSISTKVYCCLNDTQSSLF